MDANAGVAGGTGRHREVAVVGTVVALDGDALGLLDDGRLAAHDLLNAVDAWIDGRL